MSNIESVLKSEIARIARREIRREVASIKKGSLIHRSEIATLKRRMIELERRLRQVGKEPRVQPTVASSNAEQPTSVRFSARSIAAQRRRLGLSAIDCGLLVGASAQSIYNWEEGKARPRAQSLPAIFALRTLGRRQANEILEKRRAG